MEFSYNQNFETFKIHCLQQVMELYRTVQISGHYSTPLFLTLKNRLLLFVSRQNTYFSLIFFVAFFLNHCSLLQFDVFASELLFLLLLIATLITNTNLYFYYVALLDLDSSYCLLASLLLGILSINDFSKIYMFAFSLSFYFDDSQSIVTSLYQIVVAVTFCTQIYNNLIGGSVVENKVMFVGFGLISIVDTIELASDVFDLDVPQRFKISISIMLSIIFYNLISAEIEIILTSKIKKLKNPHRIFFILNWLQNSHLNSFLSLSEHQVLCSDINCFYQKRRQNSTHKHQPDPQNNYLNHLYLYFLAQNSFTNAQKNLIAQSYSRFLLWTGQPIRSLMILKNMRVQPSDFFSGFIRMRLREEISQFLESEDYFRESRRKFELIYSYDLSVSYLKKEVSLILEDKITFWAELCCPSAEMKTLEQSSSKIIDRTEALHKFYCQRIQPIEGEACQSEATIFYAGCLMATTNYIELAGELLKTVETRTSKINATQVTGIEIALQDDYPLDTLPRTSMLIKNISSKLAQSLRRKKNDLLNEKIKSLVPSYYASVHANMLTNWIRSVAFHKGTSNQPEHQSIPLRISSDFVLFSGFQCRLYLSSLTSELRLQALLFDSERNSRNFITDINGKVLYREERANKEFLVHPTIAEAVHQMKNSYESQAIAEPLQVSIQKDCNTYLFRLTYLFSSYSMQRNQAPLLRIRYEEDQPSFDMNIQHQRAATGKSKQANENESLSATNHENKATRNIMSIIKSGQFSNEKLLLMKIFFGISMVAFIILFSVERLTLLTNDNSKPLQTQFSSFKIMMGIYITVSMNKDLQLYETDGLEYMRLMDKSVLGQNYLEIKHKKIHYFGDICRQVINKEHLGQTDYIGEWIMQEGYTKLLNVTLYNADEETQLKYQQLLMRIITEMQYFQKFQFEKTQLSNSMDDENLFNVVSIGVEASMVSDRNFNIQKIGNIFLGLGFLSMIAIINFIYLKLLKKDKSKNLTIFSLLVHLDSTIIYQELQLLASFRKKIFRNSCQSEQIAPNQKNCLGFSLDERQQDFQKRSFQKKIPTFLRSKPANIDLKKSQLDLKCPSLLESFFIFFSFLVIGLLGLLIGQKNNSFNKALFIEDEIFMYGIEVLEDCKLMYYAKKYFDSYSLSSPIFVYGQDMGEFLKNKMIGNYLLDSLQLNGVLQAQVVDCLDNSLICQQSHSYKILRGIIKRAICDSFNEKHRQLYTQRQNQTYVPEFDPKIMRAELFVAQQALERMFELAQTMIKDSFAKLHAFEQATEEGMNEVVWAFGGVMALFIAYLMCLVIKKERKYEKSIKVLSLMKREMTEKNKRVQSFVNKLIKQKK